MLNLSGRISAPDGNFPKDFAWPLESYARSENINKEKQRKAKKQRNKRASKPTNKNQPKRNRKGNEELQAKTRG